MPTAPVNVTVDPAPILHERTHAASGLSYDPDLGVLTYQLDRTRSAEPVQFTLPASFEDYTLSATVETATAGSQVIDVGDVILLPTLTMYQEYTTDLTFAPAPAGEAAGKRPIKIKFTIRVRPTGGG